MKELYMRRALRCRPQTFSRSGSPVPVRPLIAKPAFSLIAFDLCMTDLTAHVAWLPRRTTETVELQPIATSLFATLIASIRMPGTISRTGSIWMPFGSMVSGGAFLDHQIAAAISAWGAGLTRSVYATHLPAFYIAGAICLAAAVAVFAIQKSTTINQPRLA